MEKERRRTSTKNCHTNFRKKAKNTQKLQKVMNNDLINWCLVCGHAEKVTCQANQFNGFYFYGYRAASARYYNHYQTP